MTILLLCEEGQERQFLASPLPETTRVVSAARFSVSAATGAEICIDLRQPTTKEWREEWLLPQWRAIMINAVLTTLSALPPRTIRINAWPGFVGRDRLEAVAAPELRLTGEAIAQAINKKITWLPDIIGMAAPRVIASIINEAYFALQEGVSTRESIDIAMKLGTNYPYGPFEWATLIGKKNIFQLLTQLAESEARYTPASALVNEISD